MGGPTTTVAEAAALLAALLVALPGCATGGGGGVEATAPPTGAAGGSIAAAPTGGSQAAAEVEPVPGNLLCDVLTAEQIRAATGVQVLTSVPTTAATGTQCDYSGGDGGVVVVVEDQTQQLRQLGSTSAKVVATLEAGQGAAAVFISGADAAVLSGGSVPGVFLLVRGHWFYLGLRTTSAADTGRALTTLAAQATPLLGAEAQ